MQLRRPGLRGTEFDVLSGITCELARSPVQRSFSIPLPQDAKQQFWDFLDSVRHPRFVELKHGFNRNHWADLYHLWTAEHNGLDFFVTLDEKFVNAVTLPKPLQTPVTVCTPLAFVDRVKARIGLSRSDLG